MKLCVIGVQYITGKYRRKSQSKYLFLEQERKRYYVVRIMLNGKKLACSESSKNIGPVI